MTEHEKDCEALERVRKLSTDGKIQIGSTMNGAPWTPNRPFGELYEGYTYRIKPEPKRVPLELKDWAGGPWWVRCDDAYIWRPIIGVDDSRGTRLSFRIMIGPESEKSVTPDQIMKWQRTKNFVTVEECWKEEEVRDE